MMCQAKLKGPYEYLKSYNGLIGKLLDEGLAQLGLNVEQKFSSPTPPAGYAFYITGTKVDQLEAGAHAVMTVTAEAKRFESGSSGASDPYRDVWSLKWESYTLKPAAFCKNDGHEDRQLTSMTGPQEISGYADRQHIHFFTQAGKDRSGYSDTVKHFWYRTQEGDFVLNDAEELVLKKTLQDKNALWHYPVLTHTTVDDHFISNISSAISNDIKYDVVIGDKIDHIVTEGNGYGLPAGCPYKFPTGQNDVRWQWVKTGDDMEQVKQKGKIEFKRTETFRGVISADVNYYGNVEFNHTNRASLETCRWKPGEV